MTPDPIGAIIGIACIYVMVYLYRNCEVLENGDIDNDSSRDIREDG